MRRLTASIRRMFTLNPYKLRNRITVKSFEDLLESMNFKYLGWKGLSAEIPKDVKFDMLYGDETGSYNLFINIPNKMFYCVDMEIC